MYLLSIIYIGKRTCSELASCLDGCSYALDQVLILLYVPSMNEHHEYFPHVNMVCFDSQGMLVTMPECSSYYSFHCIKHTDFLFQIYIIIITIVIYLATCIFL